MKQNIQKPSGFKNERKQTDDSLNLERGKTDESFISGRGDVYENTNETVTSNRLIADRDRQQRRSEADEKRGEKSKSIINSEELYSASAEDALINQRKLEDNAIKSERSKMDLAIGAERGEKERLMNKLVIQEREATDKSLKGERTITDIELIVPQNY